jgi:Cu/Ag efflux protein CusF
MNRTRHIRWIITVGVALCLLLSTAYTQQSGKREHVFKGRVEKVDVKGKSITVNGEKVEGWMGAMTMSYTVDKEDALKGIKVGDQITAKVYDGDFKVLHDVKVVPASPSKK